MAIFVFGGVATALQSRANGELALHLGSGLLAALVSFGTGFLAMVAIVLASRSARTALVRIWKALRDRSLAWWTIAGGLLGATFVTIQGFAAPALGVALFSVVIVAGQMGNSLLVDRLGLGPNGRIALAGGRIAAAVLAVIAVAVGASGRLDPAHLSIAALLAALAAGVIVPIQQGMNGRVSVTGGQPLAASWINFLVGVTALSVVSVVAVETDHAGTPLAPGPWWMFMGGLLGACFVITSAWAVPKFGVLIYSIVAIAGQLATALILDLVQPMSGSLVDWRLGIGVLLTFAAVVLATRRP